MAQNRADRALARDPEGGREEGGGKQQEGGLCAWSRGQGEAVGQERYGQSLVSRHGGGQTRSGPCLHASLWLTVENRGDRGGSSCDHSDLGPSRGEEWRGGDSSRARDICRALSCLALLAAHCCLCVHPCTCSRPGGHSRLSLRTPETQGPAQSPVQLGPRAGSQPRPSTQQAASTPKETGDLRLWEFLIASA